MQDVVEEGEEEDILAEDEVMVVEVVVMETEEIITKMVD